jgi:Asp-tRNA(Asn)/Glu-tRNA(Gln) amidotransferase A subunit family amidase
MGLDTRLSRKDFLLTGLGLASLMALPKSAQAELIAQAAQTGAITPEEMAAMEKIIGFSLTEAQRKAAIPMMRELQLNNAALVAMKLPNSVAPAAPFVPEGKQPKEGKKIDVRMGRATPKWPASDEDIAFMPVSELATLVKSRKLSPVRLTEIYLDRIKRFSPSLLNVITVTESRALAHAKQAEREIAAGRYRGPLHGIPYGIKDLFAAKGYRTTWGAEPFKNQLLDVDAAVVEMLDKAGAILIAKTSVGALAMDDHWFGGKTKNPWNPAQGSSGSSAGSASGMAAGLFAFSIGTETLGSIMSPSHRCRVTGLRPTFGRVSRFGAMALSWSMDKVGPICRTAEDCALVLAAISGSDPRDNASVDRPFSYRPNLDLSKLKIGYLSDDRTLDEDDTGGGPDDALALIRKLGGKPQPIRFTQVPRGVDQVLSVEAAAAFDEITRDGRLDTIQNSLWPDIFRQNQFATGVSYVQAMRARTLVMRKFEEELADFDVIVTGDRGSYLLFTTNLTGHPQLYIPFGPDQRGAFRGVSLIGRLYDEGTILGVGARLQQETSFWRMRPELKP